jgi:hypothetical protein
LESVPPQNRDDRENLDMQSLGFPAGLRETWIAVACSLLARIGC